MQLALVDTSVLFGAAYRRDERHSEGLAILKGIDGGALPEGVILEHVLAETLNGLSTHAGHEASVDFLERIETNERFHVESITADAFATAKELFKRHAEYSLVDACLVAYARTGDVEYCYAFDDDFDRAEDVARIDAPVDPYAPE